jgi:hypothetical protein
MTRRTNARIAGITFLVYIVVGVAGIILFNPVETADGTAAKLASIAEHPWRVRLTLLQYMVFIVFSVVLAATLYAITRDEDPDIAVLAFSCRVVEGMLNGLSVFATAGLLWLGTGGSAATLEPAGVNALGTMFFKFLGWQFITSAWIFSVGSTLFSYLFLRARSIPVWLAWLGIFGSVLLAVLLPVQFIGLLKGAATDYIWAPLAVFEVVLGFWLIIKGVGPARPRSG